MINLKPCRNMMKKCQRNMAGMLVVAALLSCSEESPQQPLVTAEELAALSDLSVQYDGRSVSDLQAEPAAMELAGQLFSGHCAECHQLPAEPGSGVPGLASATFTYGKNEEAVRTTITQGRTGAMPAFGNELGESDIGALVTYVQALADPSRLSRFGESGGVHYREYCASCHKSDGSGDPALGAPDISDSYWQHGGNMMNIRMVITRGVESSSPGFADRLTPTEVDLLTAYVLQL